MAKVKASGETRPVQDGQYIVTKSTDGHEVKIPFRPHADMSVPQPDDQGYIPEFVNISGKTQKFCVQWQETDTITVPPFGIIRGEQWRIYAEPSKAFGKTPPLMERVPVDTKSDGTREYSRVYLLDEDQLVEHAEKMINNWMHGPERIRMFLAHGKIQEFDREGRRVEPIREDYDLIEDRARVVSAMQRKLAELEKRAKVEWARLEGKQAG